MKKPDSTQQLIADAEALVGKRPRRVSPAPSTRELIADVEELLARQRPRRSWPGWVAGAVLLCGVLGGLGFWMF